MPATPIQGLKAQLFERLANLTGHLTIESSHDEKALQALQDKLSKALIDGDLSNTRGQAFSVDHSDLFFQESLAPQQRARLEHLADRVSLAPESPELRVFVRDVPVRTTQLNSSVPLWASGAAVEKTLGPFLNKDGRKLWFDFFKVTRLVALYFEGQATPAILFNVSLVKKFINNALTPVVDALTTYQLVADSVWINAGLFAANAPAGGFIGLKIKAGTINLSAHPQLVNGKLTVAPDTTMAVRLQLDSAVTTTSDPASPYGLDARNARMQLPAEIAFHLSAGGGTVDAVGGDIDWTLYGQSNSFEWDKHGSAQFDGVLNRLLIPLIASTNQFKVSECRSPFAIVSGNAEILGSSWCWPVAQLDIANPLPAAGIGGLAVRCKSGIKVLWQGLHGGAINLQNPYLLSDPGRINVTDLQAANIFCNQEYKLWKDVLNPHGSTVKLNYTNVFPFIFNATAEGNEAFLALVNANPLLDRPVTVTGQPFDIHSKDSTLIVAVNKAWKLIYLFDDNIIFDNYDPSKSKVTSPIPIALAMHNALFKVTPVNGCLLFGALADDMVHVDKGVVFLTVGMYAYVPTLPDPYAANLNILKAQFERVAGIARSGGSGSTVWLWLVAKTQWQPGAGDKDQVDVSFHFAPLQNQSSAVAAAPGAAAVPSSELMLARSTPINAVSDSAASLAQHPFVQLFDTSVPIASPQATPPAAPSTLATKLYVKPTPDYQAIWDEHFAFFQNDTFALLDVSSNANQMGVSFAWFGDRQMAMVRTHDAISVDAATAATSTFPLQIRDLDVVAQCQFVRAFTTPIVSWEPVINLTIPEPTKLDPPVPGNYYPNDGGPTRIVNNSLQMVPVAPIPLSNALVEAHQHEPGNVTTAYMTLPFGLRAVAYLHNLPKPRPRRGKVQIHQANPSIQFNSPIFDNQLQGGIQLKLTAGAGFNIDEGNMFRGYTLQMNNILDANGLQTHTSTLGEDVTKIFNNEFFSPPTNPDYQRGVPLTRIDLSGYGASTFSNWTNKGAQFAATSQARFDVLIGRTAHEVIQVKSILYPWGIAVVRTVTLFRVGSGYVYRVDSGWKAESDGLFDFRFKYWDNGGIEHTATPYTIHPGTLKGLFNVQNIKTALADVAPFSGDMDLNDFYRLDTATNRPHVYSGGTLLVGFELQPVYFDADVDLENVVQGQVGARVPARKILGFVQLAPTGIPLTPGAFRDLLNRQFGAIGGQLDCIMDIGKSGQKFRVSGFDVNASVDGDGVSPTFVAAARGHVVLPKDGSWTLVTHTRGTGDVTPLPESLSVPLIRVGALAADLTYPKSDLLRVANPAELVRPPIPETINFGFLQSTNTQKVLFLTPAFATQSSATVPGKLLSKTPPLFVDAYRLMGSKAIFPNIGDAESDLGSAIALTKGFAENALVDGGKKVLELMSINSSDGINRLKDDGYKLLKGIDPFDLPTGPWYLINEDYLKVYVEYQAVTQDNDGLGKQNRTGSLDYDVDSFAANVEDRWKSRLNNIAMAVDLGPFPRLMTIKGNFAAKKGAAAGYVGDPGDADFASPQLELSDALEKAKAILQILAALQGGDYVEAFKKGMKIAMSNGADSWEYKFEAAQEIPVLKFPPPAVDSAVAPLKLEASLKVGVYFNSALTTAALSDPKKLLPTAGAYVDFYGRMSVMCVSVAAGTIYAVGQVNLAIAGDTKVGPSVDMKFGFGAQVVVGLPVVGNVSVLYMVGVEIYADSKTIALSAFMLFQGHADLLGGLVGVTITIEAKGTVLKLPDKTVCAAEVTFAIDISIFLVIDIDFSTSWQEQRQIS